MATSCTEERIYVCCLMHGLSKHDMVTATEVELFAVANATHVSTSLLPFSLLVRIFPLILPKAYSFIATVKMAKSKREKTKATLPGMSTLAFDQLISRCWAQGLLESRDYYYNKDVPNLQSKSADFLPDHIDLSDTWVVAIVNFKLSQEDCGVLWSCVFSVKGLLRAEFVHKR